MSKKVFCSNCKYIKKRSSWFTNIYVCKKYPLIEPNAIGIHLNESYCLFKNKNNDCSQYEPAKVRIFFRNLIKRKES